MAILVVDDQAESRQLIQRILQSEGHERFLTAESAPEALRHLGLEGAPPPAVEVKLVIMDLRLPGMDGIQACRRITSEDRYKDLPVIVITASTNVGNLPAAFAAGAVDYLTKPLNPVELAARVRSALHLKREMDARKARERDLLEVTRRLEEANRELQRLSSVDGLTGLTNRRRLDEFIEHEWARAARDATPLSVVLVDIDFFKAYNDRNGHQAGDDCLRRVSGALRDASQRPGDLVARYGGEEFAVILPGTDAAGAQKVAEAMRRSVEGLALPHGASATSPGVTISLGFATMIPRPQKTSDELIAAADQALYRAKREGRNRVCSRSL